MNAGIYTMDADEYHADPCVTPSLSNSIAKILLERSPLHAFLCHPKLTLAYQHVESSQFDLGSAAHQVLLEGIDGIEVIDADDWRTKAAKEARDAARAAGKYPLLPKHAAAVRAMVAIAKDAWANCAELGYQMDDGQPEQTLLWQQDGIWLRSRLDWISEDAKLIVDYKTTAGSANPHDLGRQIISMGYDLQSAFYTAGVQKLTGIAPKFIFIFQETEKPYACSFVGMPPAFIALGLDKMHMAVRTWRSCIEANRWPAYSNRIHWMEPPAWAAANWIERSEDAEGNPYNLFDMHETRDGKPHGLVFSDGIKA